MRNEEMKNKEIEEVCGCFSKVNDIKENVKNLEGERNFFLGAAILTTAIAVVSAAVCVMTKESTVFIFAPVSGVVSVLSGFIAKLTQADIKENKIDIKKIEEKIENCDHNCKNKKSCVDEILDAKPVYTEEQELDDWLDFYS